MRWLIPFLVILILAGNVTPAWAESNAISDNAAHQEMTHIIQMVSEQITTGLSSLDTANAISAKALSGHDISEEQTQKVLNTKVSSSPYIHSSLIISPGGIVTAAAPEVYSTLVGEDLGWQEAVQYANKIRQPVMSDVFLLKEGFYGISMSYPILSDTQEYKGYTDVTFRPDIFLRQYIIPVVEENGYDMFILEKNGLNVYETNEEEIGKNILDDPLYADPEIHQVAVAITSNTSGVIRYHFWNRDWEQAVLREAVWDTLTFNGQEWRVAVVRDINNSSGTADRGTEPPRTLKSDLNASIADLNEFVHRAAVFARTEGRDTATEAFNNLSGPYVSSERYIFAYDMNGTTLALPYQAGLIGKNRSNMTDANGLEVIAGLKDLATSGGGIMYFVYPNPVADYQPQLKLVSVEPVDENWFIGSGIYLPSIPAVVNQTERDLLATRIQNAVIHAGETGRKGAIADFNDINGTYADGGAYIFAYDYNGTTLALPHQSELIGTNRVDYLDSFGSPIIRMEIDAAKRGGGFVYIVYYNPDSHNEELKLCYVSPAGNDWFVGSGMYFNTTLTG